jgi:hypothetical protein
MIKFSRLGPLVLTALAVALGFVVASLPGTSVAASHPYVVSAHVDSIVDFSDDRQLAGAVDNVFIGKVITQIATTIIDEDPETQFSVEVLDNIKGSLGSKVTVNQFGGLSGDVMLLVGDDGLLKPGQTYLFASRLYKERGWQTLVPTYGDLVVADATQRARLVERFKKATAEQIAYVPK